MRKRKYVVISLFAAVIMAPGTVSAEEQSTVLNPGDSVPYGENTDSVVLTARWGVEVIFQDENGESLQTIIVAVDDDNSGSTAVPEGEYDTWVRIDETADISYYSDGYIVSVTGPGPVIYRAQKSEDNLENEETNIQEEEQVIEDTESYDPYVPEEQAYIPPSEPPVVYVQPPVINEKPSPASAVPEVKEEKEKETAKPEETIGIPSEKPENPAAEPENKPVSIFEKLFNRIKNWLINLFKRK